MLLMINHLKKKKNVACRLKYTGQPILKALTFKSINTFPFI